MKHRIFDNGGKSLDRYTIVFNSPYSREAGMYEALGTSVDPRGCSGHTCAYLGSFNTTDHEHLGKEIELSDLPEVCRRLVASDLHGYHKAEVIDLIVAQKLNAARELATTYGVDFREAYTEFMNNHFKYTTITNNE